MGAPCETRIFFSRFPLPDFRLVHLNDMCPARGIDADAGFFAVDDASAVLQQLAIRCCENLHFRLLVRLVLAAVHLRAFDDDDSAADILPRHRLRGALGRRTSESLLDRLDHLAEPVKVERVQHHVAAEIGACEPHGHTAFLGEAHDVRRRQVICAFARGKAGIMQASPYILVDAHRLIGAPQEAAREERGKQNDAVIPLSAGARHVQFVEEPVHVEKGGREFVEDKGRAVEVDKRPL